MLPTELVEYVFRFHPDSKYRGISCNDANYIISPEYHALMIHRSKFSQVLREIREIHYEIINETSLREYNGTRVLVKFETEFLDHGYVYYLIRNWKKKILYLINESRADTAAEYLIFNEPLSGIMEELANGMNLKYNID